MSFDSKRTDEPATAGAGGDGQALDERALNESDAAIEVRGPSEVCTRLSKLRSSALRAIRSRPRVPHPLFWSLLHSELDEIKRMKERKRERRDAWLRGEGESEQS